MQIPTGFNNQTLEKYTGLASFFSKLAEPQFVELKTPENHARVIAKCEWGHPAGTIKAKVALAMIWKLLDDYDGDLSDLTVLEYSGGGLSLALAELCHELGIQAVLVLMEVTPKSIIQRLEELGAHVILTKKERGFWGVMEEAMEISKQNPNWKFLYQHQNTANFEFHKATTGQEIIDANIGEVSAWVASIGTGGTLTGVFDKLKEHYPNVQLHTNMPAEMPYATDEPSNSLPKFSGSGGLGCGMKQKFVEQFEDNVSEHHLVSFDEAKEAMFDYYKQYGEVIGSSAAANYKVAMNIASRMNPEEIVLTVFPSSGLSEEVKEMKEKALLINEN
jgi:cysteine synthase A